MCSVLNQSPRGEAFVWLAVMEYNLGVNRSQSKEYRDMFWCDGSNEVQSVTNEPDSRTMTSLQKLNVTEFVSAGLEHLWRRGCGLSDKTLFWNFTADRQKIITYRNSQALWLLGSVLIHVKVCLSCSSLPRSEKPPVGRMQIKTEGMQTAQTKGRETNRQQPGQTKIPLALGCAAWAHSIHTAGKSIVFFTTYRWFFQRGLAERANFLPFVKWANITNGQWWTTIVFCVSTLSADLSLCVYLWRIWWSLLCTYTQTCSVLSKLSRQINTCASVSLLSDSHRNVF